MRHIKWVGVASVTAMSSVSPMAHAEITNTATVTGSYGGVEYDATDDEAVAVVPAAPDLLTEKAFIALDISQGQDDRADAGDTLTYRFTITNNGNVTMSDVTPVDPGPTFNGQTGTGSLSAFTVVGTDPAEATATLAPDESAVFEAVYTLSDLDVYHAADTFGLDDPNLVENAATAAGVTPLDVAYEDPDSDSAETALTPFPELDLVKTAVLGSEVTDDGYAEVGETITYIYTVTNTGNVPLTGITVADIHEGTSLTAGTDVTSETLVSDGPLATSPAALTSTDDATANNGIWGVLQPEAVVTFTYVHTVTQQEVNDG